MASLRPFLSVDAWFRYAMTTCSVRPRSGESTGHPKTHPDTGMIKHWAVMERERRGDAGWSAEHNATRGNFDHGEKRSEDKDNEKTTISHMSRARQQVTTPASFPLPHGRHGRRVTWRYRAASHMWALSVDFNSNSMITRILPMGLWSKDMSSLTWCLVVCKSEFQK